jgi:hypothetical protein
LIKDGKMKEKMLSKILVIGIMVLFIGVSVIPNISGNIRIIPTSTKIKLSQNSESDYTILISEHGFNDTLANVTEFDSEGNIIWQITNLSISLDVERLSNGNTLITLHGEDPGKVIEYIPTGEKLWIMPQLGLPTDAERLPNGNTLIAEYQGGRVVEVDPNREIVWEFLGTHKAMDVERLDNGNTLIVEGEIYPYGKVYEVDSEGNIVWNISNLDGPIDAERLYSETHGYTTLITEHCRGHGAKVTEYDMNKSIVWQKTGLSHPQDAERLPNGSTMIVETGKVGPNRVIEVNPDGLIIWKIENDFIYPVDVEILPIIQSQPTIEIINPKEGFFHIRDRPLFPFINKTYVYGPISIKVNVTSTRGVEKIEFYANDKLKKTIDGEHNSYEYKWAPIICGRYTIKTIVYDISGQTASDSIVLFKWRAHPILIFTGFILLFGMI